MRVYLSSTYEDLVDYRRAVHEALRRAGFECSAMEDYAASDQRPVDRCLRDLSRCDVYVGIFGHRYGFIPDGSVRSITELEYRAADGANGGESGSRRIPTLIFLIDEEVPWAPRWVDHHADGNGEKLRNLKAALRTMKTVEEFRSPEELAVKVLAALCRMLVARARPTFSIERVSSSDQGVFCGREKELAFLDEAWERACRGDTNRPRIITFVGWGGTGKTSLVAHWLVRLAKDQWRGAEYVFTYSFYAQGTQDVASPANFLELALRFFGDTTTATSTETELDKGKRLATLIGERKAILVLDGLEPLQRAPGPRGGEIKDPAIKSLLENLAVENAGLCIVTTRTEIPDLSLFDATTTQKWMLEHLSEEVGARVLYELGVRRVGSEEQMLNDAPLLDELRKASREVDGHALTLHLLGVYLQSAHSGDVLARPSASFSQGVAFSEPSGLYAHAIRVMQSYERWLAGNGIEGARQLAVLKLNGLLDRPLDPGCLSALCRQPAIPELTEPIVDLTPEQLRAVIIQLKKAGLLKDASVESEPITGYDQSTAETLLATWESDEAGTLPEPASFQPPQPELQLSSGLEAHPLIREFFADQLRKQSPEAFRAGHRRLKEHLQLSVPYWPATPDGVLPLYHAVRHACLANECAPALDDIYKSRLGRLSKEPHARRTGWQYCVRTFGDWSNALGALSCFFERQWSVLRDGLNFNQQEFVMQQAGWMLRSVGRFKEAEELLNAAMKFAVGKTFWAAASVAARNICQIQMMTGRLHDARQSATQSVEYARQGGDASEELKNLTRLGEICHALGDIESTATHFESAKLLDGRAGRFDSLRESYQCFLFCDYLLSVGDVDTAFEYARRCESLATQPYTSMITSATTFLIIGRCEQIAAFDESRSSGDRRVALENAGRYVELSKESFRRNGEMYQIPRGYLSAAEHYLKVGRFQDAWAALNEADRYMRSVDLDLALWRIDALILKARLRAEIVTLLIGPSSQKQKEVTQWCLKVFGDSGTAGKLVNEGRQMTTDVSNQIQSISYRRRIPDCSLVSATLAALAGDTNYAEEQLNIAELWVRPRESGGNGFLGLQSDFEKAQQRVRQRIV